MAAPATGATVREPANHAFSVRAVMGASALCAAFLVARAITDAVSPGVAWAGGTLAPAGIAVLLVGLIIFLHVIRADRS